MASITRSGLNRVLILAHPIKNLGLLHEAQIFQRRIVVLLYI